MKTRFGVAALVATLAWTGPVLAQQAQPDSTQPQGATAPAPAPEAAQAPAEASSQPASDAAAPTVTPMSPSTPLSAPAAETPAAPAPKKERKFGYLAVFGVGAMAAGAVSLVLAGASLLNPFVIMSGSNFIERDLDGVVIPGTGTSINPFYLAGACFLTLGLVLGASGLTMLGVETYLNGGF